MSEILKRINFSKNKFLRPQSRSPNLPCADPMGRISNAQIFLFRCPHCLRVQQKMDRHHFHSCCHPFEMKYIGTQQAFNNTKDTLRKVNRIWDYETSRPKYGQTRPRPKGRSKFRKR